MSIDDFVLDRIAQPFSDAVRRHTAVTGLHVAQFLLVGSALAFLVQGALVLASDIPFGSGRTLEMMIVILWSSSALVSYRRLTPRIEKLDSEQGSVLPNRMQNGSRRVGILVIIAIQIFWLCHMPSPPRAMAFLAFVLTGAGEYLAACHVSPKPPRRRIRVAALQTA